LKPYDFPDAKGHFGPYGGVFAAETLMQAIEELRLSYDKYRNDPDFLAEFEYELKHFVGRPTPVYHARRWSEELGGAQIWFKREDLNHTAPTRLTTVSDRRCLRDAWVSAASSLKRGLVSTVLRLRPYVPVMAWSAWFTWVARTSSVSRQTCFG